MSPAAGKWFSSLAILLLFTLTLGCGGTGSAGGGAPPPSPAPAPDFSVSVSPQTLGVPPGGSGVLHLSLTTVNGFSGNVSVAISGLPAGVTASPPSPVTVGVAGQDVTLSASSSAALGSTSLIFQSTSGSLSHTTSSTLQVDHVSDFSLSVGSNQVVVSIGNSAATSVTTSAGPGIINFQLTLSVVGLPPGVTAAFKPNPQTPGQFTTLTLSASSTATPVSNVDIQIVATRSTDGAQRGAHLPFYVVPPPGSLANNRTSFIRLDTQPVAAVYDRAHGHVFASAPEMGRVAVVSSTTGALVASIPIPNPQGLSLTPDGQRVWVGTRTQQLFAIDTSTLQVVQRQIFPPLMPPGWDPSYIQPLGPAAMANGTVLIRAQVGFSGGGVIQWNPSTGTVMQRPDAGISEAGVMVGSADGSKAILTNNDTGGSITVYDAATDTFTVKTLLSGAFVPYVAVNPTGTLFAASFGAGVMILDAQLNVLATVPVGSTFGFVFSADGNSLYSVGGGPYIPLIVTVDTRTLQVVGTAPAYSSNIAYFGRVPPLFPDLPLAADETGLVFGAADHGLVLDDATFVQNFPPNLGTPTYTIVVTPDEGPVNAQTLTTIATDVYDLTPDVWFGALRSSSVGHNSFGQLQPLAPSSAAVGPVDVKVIQPTGVVSYIPQAFSYGVTPTPLGDWAIPPSGGVTLDLFGYGFGVDIPNAPIQVTVGGQPATISKATLFPTEAAYPFPLQHLVVNVSANLAGPHDIVISGPSGSATLSRAAHVLKSVNFYASPDPLANMLYDSQRQRLYLSAGTRVDVFSLATRAFLAPVIPPTLKGQYQLTGLALTPDGSKLLVANVLDQSVAILDPDNPSAGIAVAVIPQQFGTNCNDGPDRIAVTSLGKAFVSGASPTLTGCPVQGLTALDLLSLTTSPAPGSLPNAANPFLFGSKDGAHVFLVDPSNDGGFTYLWNAATDNWQSHPLGSMLSLAAASGDGNLFAVSGFGSNGLDRARAVDSGMNVVMSMNQPETLTFGAARRYGMRLHDSGSLLYLGYEHGFDLIDTHHGDLRERIALTQTVKHSVDAIAVDETGSLVFLLAGAGLTVVELDEVPLSVGSVTPAVIPTSGGSLTLRGSGFQPGSTATMDGVAVGVTVIDANTFQITAPAHAAGAVRITILNPNGEQYSLDAAFVYQ